MPSFQQLPVLSLCETYAEIRFLLYKKQHVAIYCNVYLNTNYISNVYIRAILKKFISNVICCYDAVIIKTYILKNKKNFTPNVVGHRNTLKM